MGIIEAVATAVKFVEESHSHVEKVVVFSDSASANEILWRAARYQEISGSPVRVAFLEPLVLAFGMLAMRLARRYCALEVNWVGRNATFLHRAADNIAGVARRQGTAVKEPRSPATQGLDEEVKSASRDILERMWRKPWEYNNESR